MPVATIARAAILSVTILALVAVLGPYACHRAKAVVPPPAPTLAELANATYGGLADTPITLVDGAWHGTPYVAGAAAAPAAGLVEDFLLTGNLDARPGEEAVVLLWTSSGGSGTFDYLAVFGRDDDGAARNRASAALGDRVDVRAAWIDSGRLVVDAVEPGPGDAACCPGRKVRRSYALAGDVLDEIASEDAGRLSHGDLGGVEWVLSGIDGDAPFSDGREITLAFDGDRIGGSSGCNRYGGAVVPGDAPGSLTVKMPMMGTLMSCTSSVDEVERRYLRRLRSVDGFSFRAGRLALSWRDDGELGTLEYRRGASRHARR